MKITKAQYDELPAFMKSKFTANPADADEYDNGEDDAGSLKTALQREKDEKADLKKKMDKLDADKAKDIEEAKKKALEEAREKGDFKAVEDDYKQKIAALEKEKKAAAQEVENRRKSDEINKHVEELSKNFVTPIVAKAAIRARLTAELVDGEVIVRVLGKDGKASAMSPEDLKKEYLTDADYKGSIVASKASGGGSGGAPAGGGSGAGNDSKFDAANAKPQDMIARLEAKGLVSEDDD